jgi:hypothetical protein
MREKDMILFRYSYHLSNYHYVMRLFFESSLPTAVRNIY